MSLLKKNIFIIALSFMHSACARPMQSRGIKANAPAAARPVRAQVPARIAPSTPAAPAIVQGSFQDFMQQVRNMRGNVIDDQGVFTDTFKNFVQSSGLAPELMITLMKTGRNLHLPLSGDSKKDISLILFTDQNIDDFVTSLAVVNTPIPVLANKPEDPLDYAEMVSNQFSTLKTYFIPQKNNVLRFVDSHNTFKKVINEIIVLMKSNYPHITLKDLQDSVKRIVIDNMPNGTIENGKELMKYIDTLAQLDK